MIKNFFRAIGLLVLFLMLSAQQGCQTTSSMGGKNIRQRTS